MTLRFYRLYRYAKGRVLLTVSTLKTMSYMNKQLQPSFAILLTCDRPIYFTLPVRESRTFVRGSLDAGM